MNLSKHISLKLPHTVDKVNTVSFHPFTPTVCLACANEVFEFDLVTSSLRQKIYLEGPVSHIVHSRISPQLLCFLISGKLVIYDLLSNQYQGAYLPVNKRQKARFSIVEICPNRPVVYFCRHHGNRVFELNYEKNVKNRKKLTSISHRRRVTALTVHPKGHGLFTGQLDGTVKYINARRASLLEFVERTGRIIVREDQRQRKTGGSRADDPVSVVRFGPYPQKNSTIIITGTRRGMVRVWQLFTIARAAGGKNRSGQKAVGGGPLFRVVCLSQCSLGSDKWIRNIIFPTLFPFPCCLTEKGEVLFLKTNHIIYSPISNPYSSKKSRVGGGQLKTLRLDTLPRSFIRPFFVRADLSSSSASSDRGRSRKKKRDLIQMEVNRLTGDFIFFGGGTTTSSSDSTTEDSLQEISLFKFTNFHEDSSFSVTLPICSIHHHLQDNDFINQKGIMKGDHPKVFFFDRIKAFPNILAVEQGVDNIGRNNKKKTGGKNKNNKIITTLIIPDQSQETVYYRLFRAKFSPKKDVSLLFFQSESKGGLGWIQYLSSSRQTLGGMRKDGRDGVFYIDEELEIKNPKETPFLILETNGKKLTRYPEGTSGVFESTNSIERIFYIHHPTNNNKKKKKNNQEEVEGEGEIEEKGNNNLGGIPKRKDIRDIPLMYYESDRRIIIKSCVGRTIDPDFSDTRSYSQLKEKEKLLNVYPQSIHTAILTNKRLFVVLTKKMSKIVSEVEINHNIIQSCLWVGPSLLFFNTSSTLYCIRCIPGKKNRKEESVCTLDFNSCVLMNVLFDRVIFAYYSNGKNLMIGQRFINLFDILIRHNPEIFYQISKVLDDPLKNENIKLPLPIVSNPQLRHLITKKTMDCLLEEGYIDLVGHLFSQSRYRMNDWKFHFKILIRQLEFEKCYELLIQKFQLFITTSSSSIGGNNKRGRKTTTTTNRLNNKKKEEMVKKRFRELGMVCLDYRNFEFAFLCYRKIKDLMSLFTLYATTKNIEGMFHLSSQLGEVEEEEKINKSTDNNNNNEEMLILKKMCDMFMSTFGTSFIKEKKKKKEEEESEGEKEEEDDDISSFSENLIEDKIKNKFPKSNRKVSAIHRSWSSNLVSPKETLSKLPLSHHNNNKEKEENIIIIELEWLRPELLKDWIGCSFVDFTSSYSRSAEFVDPSDPIENPNGTDNTRSPSSIISSSSKGAPSSGNPPKKRIRPEDALPDFGPAGGSQTDLTDLTDAETEGEDSDDDDDEDEDDESETETASIAGSEASSVISQSQSEPPKKIEKQKFGDKLTVPSSRKKQKHQKQRSATPNILPSQKNQKKDVNKNKNKKKEEEEEEKKKDIINNNKKGNISDNIEAEGEAEMKKYEWSSDSEDDEPDERETKMSKLRKIRIKEIQEEEDEEETEKKLAQFSFGGGAEEKTKTTTTTTTQQSIRRGGGRRGRRAAKLAEIKKAAEEDNSAPSESLVSQRLRKKLGVGQKKKTSKKKTKKKKPIKVKKDNTVRMIERQLKSMDKIAQWQMIQRMLNDPSKYRKAYVVCSYLVREVLSLDDTEIRERKMLIPAVKCLLYLKMIIHINKLRSTSENNNYNVNDKEIAFLCFHMSNISQLGENVASRSREISIEMNLKAENFGVVESQLEEKIQFAFDDEEIKSIQDKINECQGKGNKDERVQRGEEEVSFCWDSFKSIDIEKDLFLECTYCSGKFIENEEKSFLEKEKCVYCNYGSLEKKNSK